MKRYHRYTLVYLSIINQFEDRNNYTDGQYMYPEDVETDAKRIIEELKDFGIETRYDTARGNLVGHTVVTFYFTWEN